MKKTAQLGVIIRARREEVGMTQQTLAYLAGTTQEAVWAIEKGSRNPGWPTLARITHVLTLPLSALDPAVEYEVQAARGPVTGDTRAVEALRGQHRAPLRERQPKAAK